MSISVENSREIVKNLLSLVTTTLDDGVTLADILVFYTGGPETLRYIFTVEDYDAVIAVDPPILRYTDPPKDIQGKPLRSETVVPFHVIAIDKTGSTATLLLTMIRRNIQGVVQLNAYTLWWAGTSAYNLRLIRKNPMPRRMGGFDPLWRDDYEIHHRIGEQVVAFP